MKWIRGALILTVLTLVPSIRSMRTDISTEEAAITVQADTSSATPSERQLKKCHLRIHGKPPKELHHQKGENAFLECKAVGTDQRPTIHWMKDGAVIPQIEESRVSERANSTIPVSIIVSRLYLDCLSVEDEGHYSCVAENPLRRITTDTQLAVSSSGEEVSCRKKSHGQAPRIIQWSDVLISTLGESATITCRADGFPRPSIRWLGVNEEELTMADSNKFQVLPVGDLVIHNLEWSDLGTFTCIAENMHGAAKAETFLYPSKPEGLSGTRSIQP